MQLEDIISDREKKEIQKFIGNPIMRNAVEKVLLASIYSAGTLKEGESYDFGRNFAFSLVMDGTGARYDIDDKKLGEKLRACIEGISFLATGFQELDKFKEIKEEKKPKSNPAI